MSMLPTYGSFGIRPGNRRGMSPAPGYDQQEQQPMAPMPNLGAQQFAPRAPAIMASANQHYANARGALTAPTMNPGTGPGRITATLAPDQLNNLAMNAPGQYSATGHPGQVSRDFAPIAPSPVSPQVQQQRIGYAAGQQEQGDQQLAPYVGSQTYSSDRDVSALRAPMIGAQIGQIDAQTNAINQGAAGSDARYKDLETQHKQALQRINELERLNEQYTRPDRQAAAKPEPTAKAPATQPSATATFTQEQINQRAQSKGQQAETAMIHKNRLAAVSKIMQQDQTMSLEQALQKADKALGYTGNPATQPSAAHAQSAPATITSQADYDKLPAGAPFIHNGQQYTKGK